MTSQTVHVANLLVGVAVDYEATCGELRHGTRASYSMLGELVLIIRPQCRPCQILADTILIGLAATDVLDHLTEATAAASEPTTAKGA